MINFWIGLYLGGMMGVIGMCLLQINRPEDDALLLVAESGSEEDVLP